ncbi:enoyl-CoA hydratase-related protein [Nocardia aurantia]|uniref:Short-chain-enoyl-CoA hydratase n=1 Tax=Nocardia aurantia TaxID=2585199 RepID=A0A7K0DMC4_9NOCA|nr:enoyl-CoA hydratase-related protein [Nocardia aurantia]MQY25974.1 Short-chain-enoyl-CoA hydratase [Nocardia aurantia]
MSAEPAVTVEKRDRTTIVTLNRPAKRNAINPEITAGLDRALNEFEDDPEQWCAILTGGTEFFCAGADLAAGAGEPTERGGIAGIMTRVRAKPLIAAVEGFALGGGFELVMCCDLVVASRTARFGLPEPKRGLIPDFGGAFRVTRLLPANIAREMLLTGDDLDAERAERLGLVNRLVEPGAALTGALELVHRIAANAPLAIRGALRIANTAVAGDETGLWAMTEGVHAGLLASADLQEGLAAFFGRRAPDWKGQ